METKTLGLNGPTVTALGIGTWAWGDKFFWNYGQQFGAMEVEEAFNAALEEGITFFDTAEVYGLGESETLIGKFIKKQGDKPIIDIATKYGAVPWRFNKEAVYEALNNSLQRLQLSQVTLYQVHWPFTFLLSQETLLNALADEVQRGRIRCIGVSNYSALQMRQAHGILQSRGIPLAVNQVRYSLLDRSIENQGILATARELGITILAYSPLAQGLLTGKYTPNEPPDGARRLDNRFSASGLQKIAPVLDALEQLSQTYQKSSAQIALNWLVAQEGVIPIPGAKNASQAHSNAGALGWRLKEEDWQLLEKITRS